MGAYVRELGIVKGCTAYVCGKSLVLGKELLEDFTFDERQAVVGHELGHVKENHALLRLVLLAPLLVVPLYGWSMLSSPIFFSELLTQMMLAVMLNIAMLAYVMLAAIPVNWYLEVRADRISARYLGKESIKSALLKFGKKKNLKEPSETHPSIAERVKAIDKLRL
jgi:Zn-dependent protease with chaperone function